MLEFAELNWLAILVATVAAFALGWLWYGPLFGKAWLEAIGKTADEIDPSPQPFVITFFTTLLTSIVLAALMSSLGMMNLTDGVLLGAITGIGLVAASQASDSAFCGWGMPLFLIISGFRVLLCILIGAILGVWA